MLINRLMALCEIYLDIVADGVCIVRKKCKVSVISKGDFCEGWFEFTYDAEGLDDVFISQGGMDPPEHTVDFVLVISKVYGP